MKPIPFVRDTILGGICVTLFAVVASGQNPVAPAQQPDAVQKPRVQAEQKPIRRRADKIPAGSLDEKTVGDNIRASKLIGMSIENTEGKSVGSTYVLVLNVTQHQLEGAEGFDENHWPDFADRKFTDDVDKRYGIDRRLRRGAGVDVDVTPKGVDIEVDKTSNNPQKTP
jgi:hypothetical protein